MKRIVALLLSAGLLTPVLAASPATSRGKGEWPQWRGPNRDGGSSDTGLLKEWPKEGPPLLWETKGAGRGYSSLSITAGKIYTVGDGPSTAEDKNEYLLSFDEETGKQLWKAKLGPAYDVHKQESWNSSRSTPTVDGETLYVLTGGGSLVCLDTAGKEKWRKSMSGDFGGKMMSGWGYAESPLVDGDHLVCTPGGKKGTVAALDKKTGAPVWQSSEMTDNASYASLVPAEIGCTRQYVLLTDRSVAGIAAKDGKVLWRADRPGRTAVIPTPIVKDGIVFVTSGYGVGSNAWKISADGGKFKAEELYSGDQITNHHGGVILVGDHVYGTDDQKGFRCVEFKTGKIAFEARGVGKGSVAYADGHLVVRSEGGAVALVEASPGGYKETGRFNLPDRSKRPSWSHPVIAGQKLFLREGDSIHCFDLKAK